MQTNYKLSRSEKIGEFIGGIAFGLIAFGLPFAAALYKSGAFR